MRRARPLPQVVHRRQQRHDNDKERSSRVCYAHLDELRIPREDHGDAMAKDGDVRRPVNGCRSCVPPLETLPGDR